MGYMLAIYSDTGCVTFPLETNLMPLSITHIDAAHTHHPLPTAQVKTILHHAIYNLEAGMQFSIYLLVPSTQSTCSYTIHYRFTISFCLSAIIKCYTHTFDLSAFSLQLLIFTYKKKNKAIPITGLGDL
jgi:hypothetical protein